MASDITIRTRTRSTRRLNKGFSYKFYESYSDRQKPEEGERVRWLKRDNSNKVRDNSPSVDNVMIIPRGRN